MEKLLTTDNLIKRIDELIALGQEVLSTRYVDNFHRVFVDFGKHAGFRSSGLSFLSKTVGKKHIYYSEFNDVTNANGPSRVDAGIRILESVKAEITGGWLSSIEGLISSEIFSDFLEMASYLLSEGYKDPAAVMIGSVLEEHLRKLCNKHDIPIEFTKEGTEIPKKADTLNSELVREEVYGKLDQKSVTAWLDLRNNAAHGKYEKYKKAQVDLMLSGARDFITRISI